MLARLLEAIACASLPAALGFLLAIRIGRARLRVAATSSVLVGASVFGWLSFRATDRARAQPPADRPLVAPGEGYAGSSSCRPCHPAASASWHASFHRSMTQAPEPSNVLGDFSGITIVQNGERHGFAREGDAFVYVDPQGAPHRIVLLTGSHQMQIPWFSSGKMRQLAQVPFVWLKGESRWVPRNAAFLRPPEVSRRLPPETGRWNSTCLQCHSVAPLARVRGKDGALTDTHVAELGIACEACHGPGEAHVRANSDPARRYELHLSRHGDPTIVNPARLAGWRSIEVCGQCHSVSSQPSISEWFRWNEAGSAYKPGAELGASRVVLRFKKAPDDELTRTIFQYDPTFMESRFWGDGMLRVTGREMSALVETPCAKSGELTCLTCHSLHESDDDARPLAAWADTHQVRPAALEEAICTRCHEKLASPSNAKAHSHHESVQCQSCHMPNVAYGLQRAIVNHRISKPSATESHDLGRPNACNLCHLDRPLGWTADKLTEWYGTPRPELTPDEKEIAAGHVWLLSGDAAQRAIVAWNAGAQASREKSNSVVSDLSQLLDDPYESVRLIAWRSLRERPEVKGVSYDFLGPGDERQRARDLVRERVRPLERAPLDEAVRARLLGKRNDRTVDLSE